MSEPALEFLTAGKSHDFLFTTSLTDPNKRRICVTGSDSSCLISAAQPGALMEIDMDISCYQEIGSLTIIVRAFPSRSC